MISGTKISQLPVVTDLQETDYLPVARGVTTNRISGQTVTSIILSTVKSNFPIDYLSDTFTLSSPNVNINTDFLTLSGSQVIEVSSSNAALRVTQTGSGNALVIEDSTNPDATPFVINQLGQVFIGTLSAWHPNAGLQLTTNGSTPTSVVALKRNSNDTASSRLIFFKSRGTHTSPLVLSADDSIGDITFAGHSPESTTGTVGYAGAAQILAQIDGTPVSSLTSNPTRIIFSTTLSGNNTVTERLRITHDGKVGIGTTTPNEILTVSGNVSANTVYAYISGNSETTKRWETPRLITLSGATFGGILLDGTQSVVINTTLSTEIITDSNIASNANISDSKLGPILSVGKVSPIAIDSTGSIPDQVLVSTGSATIWQSLSSTSFTILPSAIVTDMLNNDAVTESKISNGAITESKIANNAVTSQKLNVDNGLTVVGTISTSSHGTSENWNSAYTIVQTNSGLSTVITSNSANWNSAYNTTTALDLSSNIWNSAYTIVQANSGLSTIIAGNSANWSTAYDITTALDLSSNIWNNTYTLVKNNSASWNDISAILPTVTNYLSTENILVSSLNISNGLIVAGTIFGNNLQTSFNLGSAVGDYSFADGFNTLASGDYSHAEGSNTVASGDFSHAEGSNTKASGIYSHAEGFVTEAKGNTSFAAGYKSTAAQDYTYIWSDGNLGTLTENLSTTKSGQYMVSASGGVFIPGTVGIGVDSFTEILSSNSLTVVGTISTSKHGTSEQWYNAFTLVQSNSAAWEESADILPTVTNYLSTNLVTANSLNVTNQLLSANVDLSNIFLTPANTLTTSICAMSGNGTTPFRMQFTNGLLTSITF